MIASLMMYERAELEGAHRRLWSLIRRQLEDAGIACPQFLSQNEDEMKVWQHPGLVLSQTCGMPYRNWLHESVSLVGTPDYQLEACAPGYYRSAFIVRDEENASSIRAYENRIFAYNQVHSQSGFAAAYWHVRAQGFWFENRLYCGQHLNSARAVAERHADIAALDAVSWRLMSRYEDFTRNLRVIEWSKPTPGLPLITSKLHDAGLVFEGVEAAIGKLSAKDRHKLGIAGIVKIPKSDYLAVANPDISVRT